MSVDELLASARAAAEALMRDRCTLRRPGAGVLNDVTGTVSASATVLAANVPCRVRAAAGQRDTEAAGQDLTVREYVAWLPLAADPGVRVGDTLTVTTSSDPRLAGRPLRVTAVAVATTAHRRTLTLTDDRE